MGQVPLGLRLDEGLLARIDAVLGDVPRSRWIARACEAALERPAVMGMPVRVDERVERGEAVVVSPARSYRSASFAKRDVRPVPKRGA